MGWQQLVLHVRAADVPRAEALLRLAGTTALAAGDAGDDPLLEPAPGALPLWPHVELRALFAAGVDLERLRAFIEAAVVTEGASSIAAIEDEDWHSAWRERITALEFGSALAIIPADAALRSSRTGCVKLHMGLAFGTGQHPTTALCLDWLAQHPPRAARVLDFGCGSGILALAALALGAQRAWAVDHDPQALIATEDNADLNDRVATLWVGTPERLPAVEVDLVLANIVAGTLIELAPRFAACTRPGATVVLSGMLADQRGAIEAAYSRSFEDFVLAAKDEWLRMTARRKRPVE